MNASIKALGTEMTLKGENPEKAASVNAGIKRNWSFGRANFKTKGPTTIEENKTFGTVEFETEDSLQKAEARAQKKPTE
jgi:hypothetical protein